MMCPRCERDNLTRSDFGDNRAKPGGRQRECIYCRRELGRIQRQAAKKRRENTGEEARAYAPMPSTQERVLDAIRYFAALGIEDPAVAGLAARAKCDVRTAYRVRDALEAAHRIRVVRRIEVIG